MSRIGLNWDLDIKVKSQRDKRLLAVHDKYEIITVVLYHEVHEAYVDFLQE